MRLITKKELAAKLSLSVEWVEQAIPTGLVPPPIELDGHIRWSEEVIDKWIRAGCPEKMKQEDSIKKDKLQERTSTLRDIEKQALIKALKLVQGNREKAAQLLGVGERTVYRKIKEYGLHSENWKGTSGVKMFDLFTDRTLNVMAMARQEAHRLNHEYIGTEHLLLALVQEAGGVSANVLKCFNVDEQRVREEIGKLVEAGPDIAIATGDKLPQTPHAKNVIGYAIEEAQGLNHKYVGTEHILLGLLRETDGVANEVIRTLGLELKEVRKEVLNLLGASPEK